MTKRQTRKKPSIKTIEDPLFPDREWIEIHDVPVSFIRQNTYLYQQRENMLQWVVDEYADIYKNLGIDALPPLECVQIDGNHGGCLYVLTDGHHRFEAAKKAGLDTVTIRYRAGTPDDAVWQSIAANKTNGLHRTNADKRKAILNALLHARGQVMSDRAIADYVGCSDKMVAAVRRDHPSLFPESQNERIGLDGKKRKQKILGVLTFGNPDKIVREENTKDGDDHNQDAAGTSQNNPISETLPQNCKTGNGISEVNYDTNKTDDACNKTADNKQVPGDDEHRSNTVLYPGDRRRDVDSEKKELADDINTDIFYTFTRLEEYGWRIELELILKRGIRTNDTVEAIIFDANNVIIDRRSYDLKPNTLTLVEI